MLRPKQLVQLRIIHQLHPLQLQPNAVIHQISGDAKSVERHCRRQRSRLVANDDSGCFQLHQSAQSSGIANYLAGTQCAANPALGLLMDTAQVLPAISLILIGYGYIHVFDQRTLFKFLQSKPICQIACQLPDPCRRVHPVIDQVNSRFIHPWDIQRMQILTPHFKQLIIRKRFLHILRQHIPLRQQCGNSFQVSEKLTERSKQSIPIPHAPAHAAAVAVILIGSAGGISFPARSVIMPSRNVQNAVQIRAFKHKRNIVLGADVGIKGQRLQIDVVHCVRSFTFLLA